MDIDSSMVLASIPIKENISPQINRIIKEEVHMYLQDFTGKNPLSLTAIEEKENKAEGHVATNGSSVNVSLIGIDDETLKNNIEKKINSLLPTMVEDTFYIFKDVIAEQIKPQIIDMIGGVLSC